MSVEIPKVKLNSGHLMPQVGVGVFLVSPRDTQANIEQALAMGYRHIDTAKGYGNEREVGLAIKASGLPREEVFVTTKLTNEDQKASDAAGAFQRSLDALALDYVDLYLIHWPVPAAGKYVATWLQYEQFMAEGRAKSIGVSNFTVAHLETLLAQASVVPAVNQVELHPLFQQPELQAFHAEHGIVTEAWGPLGQGKYALDELGAVAAAAAAHGVSPAQVVLRWHLQLGNAVFPKASSAAHQRANLDLFGFELTDAEMTALRGLDEGRRLGPDPDHFN